MELIYFPIEYVAIDVLATPGYNITRKFELIMFRVSTGKYLLHLLLLCVVKYQKRYNIKHVHRSRRHFSFQFQQHILDDEYCMGKMC